MKRHTAFNLALALMLVSAFAYVACDSEGKNEGDAENDTTSDVSDLTGDTEDVTSDTPDGIPDPTTEPPPDTAGDTPPDTATDTVTDTPAGERGVGNACTDASDCADMPSDIATCLTDIMGYITLEGGYCSADCVSDDDCGDGATCFNAFIMSICLKDCTDSSQCREGEGYVCAEVPYIGGGPFCLPNLSMPETPPDASTDVVTD